MRCSFRFWFKAAFVVLVLSWLVVDVAAQEPQAIAPTVLVLAADLPDDARVCTDAARTTCVTAGEVRALAHAPGVLSRTDQAQRDLLTFQAAYTSTLNDLDQCRGQLGPLRAQANQKSLSEALEGWIADLERRNPGWVYDRQTGALKPSPKKDGGD